MAARPTLRLLAQALLLGACALATPASAAMALPPGAAPPLEPLLARLPSAAAPAPASLAQIMARAAEFVESYGAFTPGASIRSHLTGRWDGPICLQVSGLKPEQEAAVRARIEAVARSVAVGLEPAGCAAPNLRIGFTAEPQRLLDGLVRRDAAILGDRTSATRNLRTVTRPIQAWYATNGATLAGRDRRFVNVLVIVDMARPETQTRRLSRLTDYAVMLALSQPRDLSQCNALASITDLFAACPDRFPPEGLDEADLAYLAALYGRGAEGADALDIAARMAMILADDKLASR